LKRISPSLDSDSEEGNKTVCIFDLPFDLAIEKSAYESSLSIVPGEFLTLRSRPSPFSGTGRKGLEFNYEKYAK
jgi:hypothetical protein